MMWIQSAISYSLFEKKNAFSFFTYYLLVWFMISREIYNTVLPNPYPILQHFSERWINLLYFSFSFKIFLKNSFLMISKVQRCFLKWY